MRLVPQKENGFLFNLKKNIKSRSFSWITASAKVPQSGPLKENDFLFNLKKIYIQVEKTEPLLALLSY